MKKFSVHYVIPSSNRESYIITRAVDAKDAKRRVLEDGIEKVTAVVEIADCYL